MPREAAIFCNRTSGYYRQLSGTVFMLILVGYFQIVYYLCAWVNLVAKICRRENRGLEDSDEEDRYIDEVPRPEREVQNVIG